MRTFFTAGDSPGFEGTGQSTRKFWSIEHKGKTVTYVQGREGTRGRTYVKEFPRPVEALVESYNLIANKLGEGYVEDRPPMSPLEQTMQQAIRDNPDDRMTYAAYADWLMEQPDPQQHARGEFMQVQLALEDESVPKGHRRKLQQREQELWKKHAKLWVGDLERALLVKRGTWPKSRYNYSFSRGWLGSLYIQNLWVAFARLLVHSPESQLIRQLHIEDLAIEERSRRIKGVDVSGGSHDVAALILLRWPALAGLRSLSLGPGWWADEDTIPKLVAAMPRLEELRIDDMDLDTTRLFKLKSLSHLRILELSNVVVFDASALINNRCLGALTDLTLRGIEDNFDGEFFADDVKKLARARYLTNLKRLRLSFVGDGDEVCAELVQSGYLGRLEVLELSNACLTDQGASVLANCPATRKLKLLDISGNLLSEEGIASLQALGIEVRANDQWQSGWFYDSEWE